MKKILLQFTTINYRMWHSLAVRLQELYPGSRFAGIVSFAIGGEEAYTFLRTQKDIPYEFLSLSHEILSDIFEGDIDDAALKEFEERLPDKSLWRLVAADRGLGSAFVHGGLQRKLFINQNNSNENILRAFSCFLKKFRRIFEEFKPDLFLPAVAMGDISVFIFEELCKEHHIPYLVPSNVRVKNYFAFSADTQLRFPQIDETYRQIRQEPYGRDLVEAEKLYEALLKELENPQYFDRINSRFNIIRYDSLPKRIQWLGMVIRSIIRECRDWQKRRGYQKSSDIRRQPDELATLVDNILYDVRFFHQRLRLTDSKFYSIFNPSEKYLYYPLHVSPEYSTQIQGTMWVDQVHLIELLAKSIPFDWKIYVKEHPGVLVARVRPASFYKRIKSLPNVRLIPIETDMHTVISHAQMVAVITGTSGWEAIWRGKPVITFADNTWDVLEFSRRCSDIERLSRDIHDEIQRIKTISANERRRRLICFLAAILEHSFEVSYPNQFVYTDKGTVEQYEVVGRQTADALKKHLDSLAKRNVMVLQ